MVQQQWDEVCNAHTFEQKLATDLISDDEDPETPRPERGKIGKACDPQGLERWGKHELRALLSFHRAEYCGSSSTKR
jgi:hypothetical protein